MSVTEKIDLHIHTTVSDGTDTPEQLLERVREAGITCFSVTDHDAIKCGEIIPPMLRDGDPRFIPGVEFSCKDEEGKYHILGYGYDPHTDGIRSVVETGHNLRMSKVHARVEYIAKEYGFVFPQDELDELFALDNPGKPHIGNLMVKHGYADTRKQAIEEYLNKLHLPGGYVRPEEAIAGILASGGIPVLAHPFFGSGDQLILGDEMEKRLQKLIGFGLKGVECFYSGFTDKLRREILSFAEKYNLYVTAGSDYHGKNKMIELGDTGLDCTETIPDGLRLFLEDAK